MEGRRHHHPTRDPAYTRVVYGGVTGSLDQLRVVTARFAPAPAPYNIYFGELHGHTAMSDGYGTPDEYFSAARDKACLDFCAVTDHDHGGVGKEELWHGGWDAVMAAVAAHDQPGRFVTLLGYERDSDPFYPNMCVYYRDATGPMVRGATDGRITAGELAALVAREDVLFIPHQISQIEVGVNWRAVPRALWPRLAEMYSKWGASEFFGNARPIRRHARGCFWQDALELGARIGCVAGSDVHAPFPGLVHHAEHANLHCDQPGIAGVLARDLTRTAIFDALRQRRCYACEGVRAQLDFRVNDAVMGSEIADDAGGARRIAFAVSSPAPLAQIVLVKNARDLFVYGCDDGQTACADVVMDLEAERTTDYYYLRATHADGRRAWSSPIWVTRRT
jgi:hypothetical protein